MKSNKAGGRRNYGYGRSIGYAARNAIRDHYGTGRFGTVATIQSRVRQFVQFVKKIGVKDLRDIDQEIICTYAAELRQRVEAGEFKVSTAVNYLSAVNTLMEALGAKAVIGVSPRQLIGPRQYVRKEPPQGIDPALVDRAVEELVNIGEQRLAMTLLLCRNLGLRFREASLLRIATSLREATSRGLIDITRGTKGGRPRAVQAADGMIEALAQAKDHASARGNLIPSDWSFVRWSRYAHRSWTKLAPDLRLSTKFSELRSAFACELYRKTAGVEAPVLTDGRLAPKNLDEAARMATAEALGHSRPQISASYIGTARRKKP